MIAAAPPLFLCLAVWLELGAPRTGRRTPARRPRRARLDPRLAAAHAPDPRRAARLGRADPDLPARPPPAASSTAGIALAALVLILAPRRVLRAVPYALIVLLGIGSVSAEQYAAKQSRLQQQTMLGPQQGLDRPLGERPGRAALRRPAPVARGLGVAVLEPQARRGVTRCPGAKLIGPAPGSYVGLANDGTVLVAGRPAAAALRRSSELGLLVNGIADRRRGNEPRRRRGALAALAARRSAAPGRQDERHPGERRHLPGARTSTPSAAPGPCS